MLLEKVKQSENILISSHVNPDGDSIGSGLALYLSIKKKYPQKNIRFIIEDDVPYNLKFLYGSEVLEKYKELKDEPIVDLFITTDSANFKRIGRVGNFRGDAFLINIDHHVSNDLYGDLNIVLEKSSASEIMYSVIKDMLEVEIDKEIGEALYSGIITDTGNFKYENTSTSTFDVAKELLNVGIDKTKVIDNIYKNKTLGAIKAMGIALFKMKVIEEKKFTYFTLSDYFVEQENIQKDETDGVVEKLLEYKGSEIALFMREEPNGKIKGSLRSKNSIDVNEVAKLFDGGGHKRAAGFTTTLSEQEIIFAILEKI